MAGEATPPTHVGGSESTRAKDWSHASSTLVVRAFHSASNSVETSRGQSHQAGLVAAPAGVLIGTPAGGKSGGGVLGAE